MYLNVTVAAARQLAEDLIKHADAVEASECEGAYAYTRPVIVAANSDAIIDVRICVRKPTN